MCEYIKSSPTGKYARKIWFLYEFLLEDILPIDDIGRASYVRLVNPNDYYCGLNAKIAEFVYKCVDQTVQTDLENELDFLSGYDVIKRQLKEIVDMPDRKIDQFLHITLYTTNF